MTSMRDIRGMLGVKRGCGPVERNRLYLAYKIALRRQYPGVA